MNEKFTKPYNPVETEDRIYKLWLESGYFNPDNLADLPTRAMQSDGTPEVFSMVLPPPNVTGTLHMGSALMLAIEDIMVRYARMQGKKTLWIPGTDHAAIATQSKVEKEIQKKEGKTRHDIGRDELLKRIETFAGESHDAIVIQMRKMGCSVDWSREAFTLDEKRSLAVRTAFKKMHDDGLIYRGYRVVNWDPKGQTTISDDEIVYEPRKATLYTFKYGKDIPISISTTRPETKLGDVAIAVHPDDARYRQFIGKEYDAVFAGEPIHLKVIADTSVDPAFGTGALGVTPAHSISDADMAMRHNLPTKPVINEYAKMTVGSDEIKGKKAAEAREIVAAWLRGEGLMEKEEVIDQNVSTAERTGGIVEPLPKLQWFIAVNKEFTHKGKTATLKSLMKNAVLKSADSKDGISFIPDRFEKIYFHWIENLRDWCISRQIWYGHRIPVWYKKSEDGTEEIYCGIEAPDSKKEWIQDEDTLDTWFSSGLWTFSTLGWPDEKEFAQARAYHPTTVLETGSDILFFWVARMILMSEYLLGEVPFKTVYLHGLVRDGQGRKISKSLGNNIEPLELIAKYGADAVRMSLIVAVGPGNDSKVGEDKIKAYKNFANKLWNISRFIFSSAAIEGSSIANISDITAPADIAHLKRLDEVIAEATREMNEYKFYLVAEKLYHYVWHEFADAILEESKPILNPTNAGAGDVSVTSGAKVTGSEENLAQISTISRNSRAHFLQYALSSILKLLHPFMPFITEEIWSEMSTTASTTKNEKAKNLLMVEKWPQILN